MTIVLIINQQYTYISLVKLAANALVSNARAETFHTFRRNPGIAVKLRSSAYARRCYKQTTLDLQLVNKYTRRNAMEDSFCICAL
jgi:hypothetical protein